MISEAIILAGGLGTRLKSISGDIPKPLVEVGGKPFLFHVMDQLIDQGVIHIVLAISYRSDFVMAMIGTSYRSCKITYSVEKSPMGTGGAVAVALKYCVSDKVLVVNGDTYMEVNLSDFEAVHLEAGYSTSICVIEVEDTTRYGRVVCQGNSVINFTEKGVASAGLINGGAYLIDRLKVEFPHKAFSMEEDYLKPNVGGLGCYVCKGYFIDIGIPEDYLRACSYFAL